ncbi:MAG: glycerophosphodiester phosphodiesterase [Winogradskyella sp.]|uniref:glycerophosphodiester phosphodiesterase family protein n=1 Tax=Winogradskyella sp. TaxID=1883156 RepID=UPI00184B4A58|nr:glycerophosphodiester phosphodiesterase [Winogradskyella sp.]
MNLKSKTTLDVQGHRGCRGLFPENSLEAFDKAIDLGVNTLELDIAITEQMEVIVSHEPFISRITCYNPAGETIPDTMDMQYNLYKMTYEEIKQFDCGTKFHPSYPDQKKFKTYKPLLSEVFKLAQTKNADVKFNIEIKSKPEYYGIYTPEPKKYVEIVLNEIEDANMFNRVNLQSFDLAILEEIKKQSPEMPIALLIDEYENIEYKRSKLTFKPEIISPYYKLLTLKKVNLYHDKNYIIIPWTVNEENDMIKLLEWCVDGIITDYPDKLIELKQNYGY